MGYRYLKNNDLPVTSGRYVVILSSQNNYETLADYNVESNIWTRAVPLEDAPLGEDISRIVRCWHKSENLEIAKRLQELTEKKFREIQEKGGA